MKWAVDYLKATTFRGTNGHSRMELKPERTVISEADFFEIRDGGELVFLRMNRDIQYCENIVIAFARGVWRTVEPVK